MSAPSLPRRRRWRWLFALPLLLLGAAEAALRAAWPAQGFGSTADLEQRLAAADAAAGTLVAGPAGAELVPGRGERDAFGLLRRQGPRGGDPALRPGTRRWLWLGGEPLAGGPLLPALRALAPPGEVEFLNAGVAGWDALQSLAGFQRRQSALAQDRVVLVLAAAAEPAAPVVVRQDDGYWLCSRGGAVPLPAWWCRHSGIARAVVFGRLPPAPPLAGALGPALQQFGAAVRTAGGEPRVLLLPAGAPPPAAAAAPLAAALAAGDVPVLDLGELAAEWRAAGLATAAPDRDPVAAAWLAVRAAERGLLGDDAGVRCTAVAAADAVAVKIDAGPAHANRPFLLLGSRRGIAPPADLPGGRVPLADDPWLRELLPLARAGTPPFGGRLDAAGRATATLPPAAQLAAGGPAFLTAAVLDSAGRRIAAVARPVVVAARGGG